MTEQHKEQESARDNDRRLEVMAWTLLLASLAEFDSSAALTAVVIRNAIHKRAGDRTDAVKVYRAEEEAYDQLVKSGLADKIASGLITPLGAMEVIVRFANGEDV